MALPATGTYSVSVFFDDLAQVDYALDEAGRIDDSRLCFIAAQFLHLPDFDPLFCATPQVERVRFECESDGHGRIGDSDSDFFCGAHMTPFDRSLNASI